MPAPVEAAGLVPVCTGAGLIYVDPATGDPVKPVPGGATPCHAACRSSQDDEDDGEGDEDRSA